MKKCFKCKKSKPLTSFYSHKGTADKHLNKCKICTKKDVSLLRRNPKFREKILQRDRDRANEPKRKSKHLLAVKLRRQKYKGKARANAALNHAVRDGKIKKLPCEVCGNIKVEGHHPDYRKKLQVIWLCNYHHRKIHNRII